MNEEKMLTVLVPAYNEEKSIPFFLQEITPILNALSSRNITWNILFINDGSDDNTINLLSLANQDDKRIKTINLSRNFGKESAITCGLQYATSSAVIIMDADLQHPPKMIPKLIDLWLEGYNMVIPINRQRTNQSFIYKIATGLFYGVMDRMSEFHIPRGGSDFRLMDRKVIDAINLLPEKNRFMKALYAYPGFNSKELLYTVRKRKFGKSKWSIWKLWNFALDGILGFTSTPLKIWVYIGFVISFLSFSYGIYIMVDVLINGKALPGWPTIVSLILFFNGLLMINNGIIGEYIARIFEEIKQRPMYFVNNKIGFDKDLNQ